MDRPHASIAPTPPIEPTAPVLDYDRPPARSATLLGHPAGLFVLFLVEMWERFSYYGMRALLVLYLIGSMSGQNPGRGWSKESASNLYGWYAGMAYLLPIFGGLIADKLIGAHRSMLVGGTLITLGHLALAFSGFGGLASSQLGMSIFVMGLALIVIGTGHFKPNVSVMVGQLYPDGDPRRDGAFTIFYMGINIGAFVCAFVCGTLGEKVGWHWGFGAAAIGMMIGLAIYLIARPKFLTGVGELPTHAPKGRGFDVVGYGAAADSQPLAAAAARRSASAVSRTALLLGIGGFVLATLVAGAFHADLFGKIGTQVAAIDATSAGHALLVGVRWLLLIVLIVAPIWFVSIQAREDRGPVAAILIFIFFNAIFWLGYEQGGTSLNLFAAELTERHLGSWEMPATWFQSVGALLVILLAPLFAALWSWLDRRNMNPSQPLKMAIGLALLAMGYGLMVLGSMGTTPTAQASMFWLIGTYFMHTLGELCISPTGLAFVTRAAPLRFLSFLMGLSFLSNSLANWAGGRIAGQIDAISNGQTQLPWSHLFAQGSQATFFFLFVVATLIAGALVLALTPLLKRMLGGRA